ncbi:uncharacterized protein LOC143283255 isoform X1 [Babylonia areolata]|uniref:uncharacterized protein LOC143283255 isoform X1 n=1 Tax=Babylonia areolata TaxID=304850 RepID=UPI003FD04B25
MKMEDTLPEPRTKTVPDDLRTVLEQLQTDVAIMKREQKMLHGKNNQLAAECQTLRKSYTEVKAENVKLKDHCTYLEKDVKQDVAVFKLYLDAFQDDHRSLLQAQKAFRENLDSVQARIANMNTVHTNTECIKTLEESLIKATSVTNALATELDKVKVSVKTDYSSLQADIRKLQSDQDKSVKQESKVQRDVDQLQVEQKKMEDVWKEAKSVITALEAQLDKVKVSVKTDYSSLQADVRKLQSDQGKSVKQESKVQHDVDQLQVEQKKMEDVWKEAKSVITALEAQLDKVKVQVAFHTQMTKDDTCSQPQTIVCDRVVNNVGDGYNPVTGVFTAPVSGTYSFMANSSPNSDDVSERAALVIVVEERPISGLVALGRGWSTAHCAVHVQAGQTVSLRSHHVAQPFKRTFGKWATYFTGMLLQPDL